MNSGGAAALMQLNHALMAALLTLALLFVSCLLVGAISASFSALGLRRPRPRAERTDDSWIRAEAARGIVELDRYLRRWDVTR